MIMNDPSEIQELGRRVFDTESNPAIIGAYQYRAIIDRLDRIEALLVRAEKRGKHGGATACLSTG